MNIVIYGLGKVFKKVEDKINWNEVVAIIDSTAEEEQMYRGKPVYKPQEINNLSYDYVVICSLRYFRSMRRSLIGDYYVDEQRILSYNVWGDDIKRTEEEDRIVSHWIEKSASKRILDIGLNLETSLSFAEPVKYHDNIKIDGVGDLQDILNRRKYFNYNNSKISETMAYDGIIYNNTTTVDMSNIAEYECKWCIYISGYGWDKFQEKEKIERYLNKKCVQRIATVRMILYFFTCEDYVSQGELGDVNLYVVSHKKYNLLNNDIYVPICVGKKPWTTEYVSECNGENIVEYNDRLNECTALYWMWKNSKADVLGLSHYRRYFYNDGLEYSANYLDLERLEDIFKQGYDIVLPNLLSLNFSVAENIKRTVGQEVYDKAYRIVAACMENEQPEYIGALEETLQGNSMYVCNMFVTSKEVLDMYAEWLFSFIVDAAEQLDVDGFNNYQRRTIGYFAEIMMTCWIKKQNLKIFELPVTNVWLE